MRGTIRRIFRDRGFGFIRTSEGQEVFFHRSDLWQLEFSRLKEGDNVEFELDSGPKGFRAVNVRPGKSETE